MYSGDRHVKRYYMLAYFSEMQYLLEMALDFTTTLRGFSQKYPEIALKIALLRENDKSAKIALN